MKVSQAFLDMWELMITEAIGSLWLGNWTLSYRLYSKTETSETHKKGLKSINNNSYYALVMTESHWVTPTSWEALAVSEVA